MKDGVQFEPSRTFPRRKCEKANGHKKRKKRARHWVIIGPVTHDVVCVGTVGCKAMCVSSVVDLVRTGTAWTTVRGGKSYGFRLPTMCGLTSRLRKGMIAAGCGKEE